MVSSFLWAAELTHSPARLFRRVPLSFLPPLVLVQIISTNTTNKTRRSTLHFCLIAVSCPILKGLFSQTAVKCPLLGPRIEEHSLNSWQALCAHLLCERARARSFWAPYIEALPSETVMQWAHPLLWPSEERCEWLKGSPILTTLETRLEQCRWAKTGP